VRVKDGHVPTKNLQWVTMTRLFHDLVLLKVTTSPLVSNIFTLGRLYCAKKRAKAE
jgi:hypothetical protein